MCSCQSSQTDADLMTLRAAARVLCVSYNTILLWTRKGVFRRVVRVGPAGAMRLYRADVFAQRRDDHNPHNLRSSR